MYIQPSNLQDTKVFKPIILQLKPQWMRGFRLQVCLYQLRCPLDLSILWFFFQYPKYTKWICFNFWFCFHYLWKLYFCINHGNFMERALHALPRTSNPLNIWKPCHLQNMQQKPCKELQCNLWKAATVRTASCTFCQLDWPPLFLLSISLWIYCTWLFNWASQTKTWTQFSSIRHKRNNRNGNDCRHFENNSAIPTWMK